MEQWQQILPSLKKFQEKKKYSLKEMDKDILQIIDFEVQRSAEKKYQLGHYKQNQCTFMSTFANLNPLKSQYYEITAFETFSGSSFHFEPISNSEIQEINEILSNISAIIELIQYPVYLNICKFQNQSFKKISFQTYSKD